ncbi:MAG: HAMP domain-containing sensor histidine kinase [Myxococcota bacterium]
MSDTASQTLTRIGSVIAVSAALFSIPAFIFGFWVTGGMALIFPFAYFGLVVYGRHPGRSLLATNLFGAVAMAQILLAVSMTGGPASIATQSIVLIPVLTTLISGPRYGWIWLTITMIFLGVMNLSESLWLGDLASMPVMTRGWLVIGMMLVTCGAIQAGLSSFAGQRNLALEERDIALASLEKRVEARTIELKLEVEQRRIAEARAAQANHAKTAFLMNMSHELRTPLNAIRGYAELLGEELEDLEVPTATYMRDLTQITGASRHLLGLIDNILEYARIEEGQIEAALETIDLGKLLHDMAHMIRPVIQTRSNTMRLEVLAPDEGPLLAFGDAGWIRQIVINLVSNANKLSNESTITVRASAEGNVAMIAVEDEGPGIEPALIPRLFERFTRGTESIGTSGTGLGLAISHDLATRMNGTLSVQSTLGQGTTFVLTIPIA